ncbi:Bug family tripartite tricarboxylate transporter substrate binding protein [Elioraea rosea]|uniref:Bug family tripartite tricarboxylate transporter substrate binding protein n=1 Tax=Elioraea rosea TaxID=2492390 RepID=UPI00131560D3|nr:tripartite tricarboxylate transporter substrate binding protein [Elioraea rosea]
MHRRIFLGAAGVAFALPAGAQADFPSRPLRLIVPFAPGGSSDVMARLVAGHMGNTLGQSIVVENRGGAGGNIGAEAVARAAPDGYTIGTGSVSILSINKHLYARLPFDPDKDFTPIGLVGVLPNILIAHPSVPVTDLASLIAYVRANPGKLSYASTGSGTSQHLAMEMLKTAAGLDIPAVTYRGSGQAIPDLVAGRVELMVDTMVTGAQLAREGQVRAIAVTTEAPSHLAPDMPRVSQTIPGFDAGSWLGIIAPAGVPAPVARKLEAAVEAAVKDPTVAQRLRDLGVTPTPLVGEAFARFVAAESAKWGPVVRASGARVE